MPALEKNHGYWDCKFRHCKKNSGPYRDFKSQDWKKIPMPDRPNNSRPPECYMYLVSRIERPYNRENFPGASRPSKTLTGVLIGTENWLSLGGGRLLYIIPQNNKIFAKFSTFQPLAPAKLLWAGRRAMPLVGKIMPGKRSAVGGSRRVATGRPGALRR